MTAILYDYWRSSSAYRVRIGLNLAKRSFETRSINLVEGEQNSPEYLHLNPQGFVPTLLFDGLKFTQSVAILEYLHDTGAIQILPDDAAERARVRALAYAVSMDIHPVCNVSVAKFAVEQSEGKITTETWMRHFIERGLSAYEALLEDHAEGKYSHGDTVTLADICLVPQVYNALRWGVDVSKWPRIGSVLSSLQALPEVSDAHPDRFKP